MSDPAATLVATLVAAVVTGAVAAAGPAMIRRLPEPDAPGAPEGESDSRRDPEPDRGVEPSVPAASVPAAKVPYAELGARPTLAAKLAVVGVVVGAVVGWGLGWVPVLGAWIVLGGVGVVLAYVDAQTRLLPTRIIGPTYGVLVAALVAAALADSELSSQGVDTAWADSALVGAAVGWAAFGGFYLVLWLIAPRWLGYGDVRLAGLLGLALGYLGWGEVVLGMYAGFVLGGVLGGLLSIVKVFERRYPFGPFMLLGALVGLLFGAPFADWYAST